MSDGSHFQSRRTFLKAAGLTLLGASLPKDCLANTNDLLATLIDIDICNGCGLCVEACRRRSDRLVPLPQNLANHRRRYKFARDWSQGKFYAERSRLTPYNWLTIQTVRLHNAKKTAVYVPRRCMHCISPTCAVLCPTGAVTRDKTGAVYGQLKFCVGCGSCTMNCPWYIPMLQPGVGDGLIFTTQDASCMFKCDYCLDLQLQGQRPLCIQACPTGAMQIGPYEAMVKRAHELAAIKGNNDVFGLNENGGTLTLYVSSIRLRDLEIGLLCNNGIKPGLPTMRVKEKPVEKDSLLKLVTATPFAAWAIASLRLWRERHMH